MFVQYYYCGSSYYSFIRLVKSAFEMSYFKQIFTQNTQKPVPITLTIIHSNVIGNVPFAAIITGLTFYKNQQLFEIGGRFRKAPKFSEGFRKATKMHPRGGAHIFLFDENDNMTDFIGKILEIFSGTFPVGDSIWD